MTPELKSISLQTGDFLEEFQPDDPENFGVSLRLMIGAAGSEASDSFDLLVCTPAWITNSFERQGFFWGRHSLVIPEFNPDRIRRSVEWQLSRMVASDWSGLANMLSRLAAWEFEDYQPYTGEGMKSK